MSRKYYLKNRKKIIEMTKKWKENNKDKQRAYDRKYRSKWKKEHKKENVFQYKRWRARKFGNGGSHTIGEWETLKAQYNWTCLICGKQEPQIKLTEDHIIPLSKGGSDNIENIQPLCKTCNCKKSDKI
jgi:5-methylcytosine-specific restriction endonuclease McrA